MSGKCDVVQKPLLSGQESGVSHSKANQRPQSLQGTPVSDTDIKSTLSSFEARDWIEVQQRAMVVRCVAD